MRFQVPQFIERETRIAGPLTFKQFVMFGFAGALTLLAYFFLVKTSFFLFLLAAVFIVGGTGALAFLKVGGRNLPTVLDNIFSFFASPKVYLWRKKELPPRIVWKTSLPKPPKSAPASANLKMAERSRLRQIAADVETKR